MPLVLVDLLQSTGTKGGIEVYVRELYKRIEAASSAFQFVGFASSQLASAGAPWFPGRIIDSGISGENRFSWARGELLSVSQMASRLGADLIHGPAMLGPIRSKVPVVLTIHDLLYFSHPELMQTKIFTEPVKWMERRAAANATRVITISEYSATAIRRYLRVASERIDVIPLAARTGVRPEANKVAREKDFFLSIGQRSPYKDFESIVKAWALIDPSRRPRLLITGSHGKDPLVPLVRRLGLANTVELREWVSADELDRFFSTATALIDSTLATGFSLPTLEAMSIGLPVILADTEVFREVGADAASYFRAGDPADLVRAVLGLDEFQRRELTSRGFQRATQFSWDRVAAATVESFERTLIDHRNR